MLPREERYIQHWESESRNAKQKWRYMILSSLIWGSLLPIIVLAFRLAIEGSLTFDNFMGVLGNRWHLMIWLLCTLLIFLKSFVLWHLARNKYLSLKRKQREERGSNTQ